jgi:hypothetical protein
MRIRVRIRLFTLIQIRDSSAFNFNVDPNADLDPAQYQSDANLRPLVYKPSRAPSSPLFHGEPLKLLNLVVNANPDQDPAIQSNADPDPDLASQNNADPKPQQG